jgi:hypothetical protein
MSAATGSSVAVPRSYVKARLLAESRFRKFAQDDKWSFCLTAGRVVPANQERP